MKKFYIDYEEVNEDDFYQDLEYTIEGWVEDGFDDMLDQDYETLKIGYLEFYPSQVLRECDPTAYRCMISDYQSSELDNAKWELENNGEIEINGTSFEIKEEEEEE